MHMIGIKELVNPDIPLYLYHLDKASDEELLSVSRNDGLSLSLEEMHNMREYFIELGRTPTDIEVQALAQAWSEHSCYKSSKTILKKNVFDIKAPQNILVIKEDAGVVEFDKDHAYVVALESHNHPSAIEPYGGAATGIGGILRDVACMGAQPIALMDPLFFGKLDYPQDKLPEGVKHPKYLLSGVVSGIRDYGNRVGIPTISGMVYFDNGYLGNCLVNVGCIGMVKKENITRSMVRSEGSLFLLAGGRTGRDGIHGVTFASDELTAADEEESMGAVQLGDPITKEPLIHACLECVDKKLIEGMKDCGGGGLSSVVGEMALAGGFGAMVDLEKVPLKESGLAPWEIWISESQERMMLAVPETNLDKVTAIMGKWDVEATVIGRVVKGSNMTIKYDGETILDLDLNFYTAGPVYSRPYQVPEVKEEQTEIPDPGNLNDLLLRILSSQNVCSKEWVIRQYDHEVRASTVIKPLQGRIHGTCHGDASVLKPLEDSFQGLAVTIAVNPEYMKLDPYWGAVAAVDETCRNLVSVGARPHSMADCLNYGNPEKPDRLGYFYETARGFGDIAKHLTLPFVSGNVSFYNEHETGQIPPTPTILGCGIIPDVRKAVTMDLKSAGDSIFLVGATKAEFGGSTITQIMDVKRTDVPKTSFMVLEAAITGLLKAMEKGVVRACHDLSDGGLAVAMAEMCIGGNLGAKIALDRAITEASNQEKLHPWEILFSESNTRWLVEVSPEHESDFLGMMTVPCTKIGVVTDGNLEFTHHESKVIDLDVDRIRRSWESTIQSFMG